MSLSEALHLLLLLLCPTPLIVRITHSFSRESLEDRSVGGRYRTLLGLLLVVTKFGKKSNSPRSAEYAIRSSYSLIEFALKHEFFII